MMKSYIEMNIDELFAERRELFAAIQNEKLWQGACTEEWEINMHQENIEDLRAQLRHVIMLISQKRR